MGYTPSVDASQLLRLICHAPAHEESPASRLPYPELMAIQIQKDHRQQWAGWVQDNVAPPFRKRALKAALKSLASGGNTDQAIAAAKAAEAKRADYMATSALVLGAISAAVGLLLGGLSILATLFAIASAVQGRRSIRRAWQAWTGLGLACLGIVFFVASFALRQWLPS